MGKHKNNYKSKNGRYYDRLQLGSGKRMFPEVHLLS